MFVSQKSRILQRVIIYVLTLSLLVLITACAKIGTPYGGPVDEDPPKIVKTNPPENSVNFSVQKNIEITFDEYIQLQNVYQELIVSPPLEERVVAQLKGKSIVVQFSKDAVFDTTTYTINFGNSIVDNNESNVLKNYEFIFSLKDHIDSMKVEGRVLNAFNHSPDEERMYFMLYKNLNDSAPLLENPTYISRANKEGYFSLHNLETGLYRLFGLKDVNANMIFDIPEEQIAFYDSIVELTPERFKDDIIIEDTMLVKLLAQNDSVLSDSSVHDSLISKQRKYSFNTELLFFTEKIKNQYLVDFLRPQKEQLFFHFNEPLADTFHIMPLNFQYSKSWYILDAARNNDTLIFWLTDTSLIELDSLQFNVTYPVYDSLGFLIPFNDTLFLVSKAVKDEKKRGRRNKDKEDEPKEEEVIEVKRLALSNNIKNAGSFDLNKNIDIITKTPCFNFRTDRFQLFFLEDTLEYPRKIEIIRDTNSFYRYSISYEPEELTTYKVIILDSALTDIYGSANDTTIFQFKTRAADFYGILSINLSNINDPIILQLLDENERIVKQHFIKDDQRIRYEYLHPKKYILKIIVDSNNNGKWDTGNYLKKIQPERVLYYSKEINIRSNWEIDINWPLD